MTFLKYQCKGLFIFAKHAETFNFAKHAETFNSSICTTEKNQLWGKNKLTQASAILCGVKICKTNSGVGTVLHVKDMLPLDVPGNAFSK